MSELLKKMQAAYNRVRDEAVAGVYGQRYVPAKGSEDDDNPDIRPDFPYIDDPKGYTTHIPLEMDDVDEADIYYKEAKTAWNNEGLREQDEEEPLSDEGGEEMPPEGGEEIPPEAGIDSTMDPAIAGMPPGQKPLTFSQIGRVFELKKIYSRLTSVETFLARTTDEQMLEIRKMVGQSIDLFELVISNFTQYKEKVDEIIVTYYEFLDSVYSSLKTYFSEMSKEQKNDRS